MGRGKTTAGFTVLELLVATAISVVLIALFLSVSSNILDAWGASRDTLSSNAKARIVLDTLASDLESAILREGNGVWLACNLSLDEGPSDRWESSNLQKPGGPASLEIDFDNEDLTAEDYRFGVAGTWIRFFGSPVDASASGDGGDVNAIAYQLIRRKPHSRSTDRDEGYNLYRSIVRSDYTLEEAIEDGGYFINLFDGNSYEGQPGEIQRPRGDTSLLVRDVVDFGVVLYDSDSAGNRRVLFPNFSNQEFLAPMDGLPTSAEIFVRILDEEGVKQINAYERGLIPGTDTDFWWDTVNQYSSVYSTHVYFKSLGL